MYIYNITFNIEETIQQEWLTWINQFFAETIAIGNFTSTNIHQVMIQEEMGGVTYAVQFNTSTKETLEQFQQQELVLLQKQMQQLFNGKYVFFHTELKVVTQFQP
ncbi:MAG: DUF4286 family protein [Flavobacteriaceae bacterium]|nr:DUF4286 family protein [Flavobacteriaceae bacterium]